MEHLTYTTIDRTGWPKGVWDNEPDKVQWQDQETGLPCLAVRHRVTGNWCGYVGVPPEHPWHGRDYSDIHEPLEVHGGLTFSDACSGGPEDTAICHVPGEGEPDHAWWFGFDCGHCYDLSPGMEAYHREIGLIDFGVQKKYRTLEYVKNQCHQLALQLIAHGKVEEDSIVSTKLFWDAPRWAGALSFFKNLALKHGVEFAQSSEAGLVRGRGRALVKGPRAAVRAFLDE